MPPVAETDRPRWRLPRSTVAALVLAGCALLGASVLATQTLWRAQALAVPAATCTALPPTTAQAGPAHDAPEAPALDGLRIAAALGNEDAGAALAGALLDRYDQLADERALFEALQWLERDMDSPRFQAFALVDRVVGGACARDPALKWHWLCNQAE